MTVNTWARWERGELAIRPAYQLLLDYLEARTDRDADRTAARLLAPESLLQANGVVLGGEATPCFHPDALARPTDTAE